MMSIPVIGVPVVNSVYWITRLVASVDYPVDQLIIINNNGRGEIDDHLNNLVKMNHPFIKQMKVVHMPANIGVAGSWNLTIKSTMNAKYWVFVNDDVAFKPGCLQEIDDIYNADPDMGMVHPEPGEFEIGTWDCFAISDRIIQLFGLFDENTYPAYCEDADYIMRLAHRPIKKVIGLHHTFYHGYEDSNNYYAEKGGSNTSKADKHLAEIVQNANVLNIEYLTRKWGAGWRTLSPTQLPFEKEDNHISASLYDLEFVRSKYTGF